MRRRAAISFLGLALAGCGTDRAELPPTAPLETTRASEGTPSGAAAPSGAEVTERLGTGPYAADGTLCTDSSEALHALMPEAFVEGEETETDGAE